MVKTSSFVGSIGERAVNCIEVDGKVEEFGFPTSMEMMPGLLSSGMRLLAVATEKHSALANHQILHEPVRSKESDLLGLGILVFKSIHPIRTCRSTP